MKILNIPLLPFLTAAIIFAAALPTLAQAQAHEVGCYVKRVDQLNPEGHVILQEFSDLEIRDQAVRYLTFASLDSVPALMIKGETYASGTSITQANGNTTIQFAPIRKQNAGASQQPDSTGPINRNHYDQEDFISVTLNAAHPEANSLHYTRYKRNSTRILGVEVQAGHWKKSDESTRELVGCEFLVSGQVSQRPPLCTSLDLEKVAVGTKCSTTANAAVYEKVLIPGQDITGWKDPNGIIWGPSIGTRSSRLEAQAACNAVGGSLPKWTDFDKNLPARFEEVVDFAHFGEWHRVGDPAQGPEYMTFFTADTASNLTGVYDAVFVIQKGWPAHGSVEDSDCSAWVKPFNAVCVYSSGAATAKE